MCEGGCASVGNCCGLNFTETKGVEIGRKFVKCAINILERFFCFWIAPLLPYR